MLTRPGSIRFWLVFFFACGTPAPVAEMSPQNAEPAAAAVVAPSPAFIDVITVDEPSHSLPEGAPAALARFPAAFERSEPYDLVVFLHGWSGCINVLMRDDEQACVEGDTVRQAWNLGETLGAPQRVLLMPQLAFQRRDGDAGLFEDPEYTRDWLAHVLVELSLDAPRNTVLMPHSAGFETALAWAQSGVPIDAIFLMDALYAKAPDFFAWASADEERVLVTFYTGGSTGRQSRRLARMAEREGVDSRVRRVHTRARHAEVPSAEGPGALREFFENAHHGARVDTGD
ncbi:MAG: pimeloyl-ACP methyl ester carboxylesterase [Polyangiales bacterium]